MDRAYYAEIAVGRLRDNTKTKKSLLGVPSEDLRGCWGCVIDSLGDLHCVTDMDVVMGGALSCALASIVHTRIIFFRNVHRHVAVRDTATDV